ncbi:hypothetical protein LX64_05189 [Chitinophaga skermanii]|uniref:Uncharacterized protein n=1 Tax=Chitinophaga skermanii TaxID=331697 RepID=A0A327PY74_9BACT|nr:hypothetical protein LX64_05189 [Chitinophaga skermanii]
MPLVSHWLYKGIFWNSTAVQNINDLEKILGLSNFPPPFGRITNITVSKSIIYALDLPASTGKYITLNGNQLYRLLNIIKKHVYAISLSSSTVLGDFTISTS